MVEIVVGDVEDNFSLAVILLVIRQYIIQAVAIKTGMAKHSSRTRTKITIETSMSPAYYFFQIRQYEVYDYTLNALVIYTKNCEVILLNKVDQYCDLWL